MNQAILEKILKAEKLPSLPTVAMEVVRLMKNDDVDVDKLAKLISNDPALTVSTLKMINSTAYAMSREITSIKQAMMLLGMRSVKLMALSFSLVNVFPTKDSSAFDYPSYWRRSLTSAAASRLLAKASKKDCVEEAFISGLLSDIGMVAAWHCAEALYKPVLERWADRARPLPEIENELLGADHTDMGSALLKSWKLPAPLCEAVGAHHGKGIEDLDGLGLELARVVSTAASIAGVFCKDTDLAELDALKAKWLETMKMDEATLDEALEELDQHVKEAASLLSVEVGETLNYAQLQMEAAGQLVRISMQAELERAESAQKEQQVRTELETKVSSLESRARKADELEKSVKGAGEVQRRLMPRQAPPVKNAQLDFLYQPAQHVSGDFFDFVAYPDGRVGFLIGDLAGHGVEAGILMGLAKRCLVEQLKLQANPFEAVRRANDDLCQNLDQETFLTACLAIYNPGDQTIQVASAGHDPPMIFRPSADAFAEVDSAGPLLGAFEGIEVEESEPLELKPDDVLLVMTDGVFECMNSSDDAFGKDRLQDVIRKHAASDVQAIMGAIDAAVIAWRGDRPPKDDITVLGLKILEPPKKRSVF